jgi:pimeloyl-ACP methyl ester carboxylesterase
MNDVPNRARRRLIGTAAMGIAAAEFGWLAEAEAQSSSEDSTATGVGAASVDEASTFGKERQLVAGPLDVGFIDVGPFDGSPVILLHGWPYDIHSYAEVAPLLAQRGCRVIVPYLRGHGRTRFRDATAPRSGQQAAIGADLLALMNALHIQRAVLAGYDWGGRAACVVAALWPERCSGLVSVNGYLIQDIAKAVLPIAPPLEAAFWYQYYFLTERGRAGLAANRRDIARLMWARNSPRWRFDDTTFERSAPAFDHPDYVEVVVHSYRHRLGAAAGHPEYAGIERLLAAQPVITVPTITLDGNADGVVPATDGTSSAAKFIGGRQHRIIPDVGHNLPQEAPASFAAAVWELVSTQSGGVS